MSTKELFLTSAAFRIHPGRKERESYIRGNRKNAFWLRIFGLLCVTPPIVMYLYSPPFDTHKNGYATLLRMIFVFGAWLLFMGISIISDEKHCYDGLIRSTSTIARELYKVDPERFYTFSDPVLIKQAERILVQLAQEVLNAEKETRIRASDEKDFEQVMRSALSVQKKRDSFNSTYRELKESGIIQDIGYSYYYKIAQKELAPELT